MKAGILVGVLGHRLPEEINLRTKPMVKVDGDLVSPELICLFVRCSEAWSPVARKSSWLK